VNKKQFERMKEGKGFIAALDQSGGSTPKALKNYGITKDQYDSEEKMFDLVHEMRTRIITSPSFTSEHILAAILFEKTMDGKMEGMYTGDYLWQKKGIIPILKIDKGLSELEDGVQLMNPITDLDEKLKRAKQRNIFGTKMRSVIKSANFEGIKKIVDQQFKYGKKIVEAGFIPILEPEVNIFIDDKDESEHLMKAEILKHLEDLSEDETIMLKLSLPSQDGLYSDLINHQRVMRVAALSGGYSRKEAVDLLSRNEKMIASYSRALLEGLNIDQSDEEFNETLKKSINQIYKASIT